MNGINIDKLSEDESDDINSEISADLNKFGYHFKDKIEF